MTNLFVTGTDTNIGKTTVTAGIVAALKKMNKDVGVMKPFAAGTPQENGYKSADVQLLTKAAQVNDVEKLVNPYFFEIPASPYTATNSLGIKFDVETVLDCYKELSANHEIILIEGIGGAMTPILEDYFVTSLIKDMDVETIIITSSRIGTVNHTLMTCKICEQNRIKVKGIIINVLDSDGYEVQDLTRDLEKLTKIPIIGIIPFLEDDINLEKLATIISDNVDLKLFFK